MENFKQEQQDRINEGKELKHEDQLRDLSQIPAKQLPGAENKSLLNKISEGISNVANTISDKVGLSEKTVEGYEGLDKTVVKQHKKVNAEILKKGAEEGFEGKKGYEWMNRIPEDLKKEIESVKISKLLRHVPRADEPENKSLLRKISEGISNVANTLSDKVGLSEKTIEGHEDLDKKIVKQHKKVNAEVLKKSAQEGFEGNNGITWMNRIPEDLKKEIESVKISKLLRHVPRAGESENKSFFSKISGGLTTLAEKIGLSDPVMEGHEDLDKDIRKQLKKVNKEIRAMGAEKAKETPKTNEWESKLPKQLKKDIEEQGENLASKASAKLSQSKENKSTEPAKKSFAAGMSERINEGVNVLKDKFNTRKEESASQDGTKVYKTVKDGFKENVDELKHEKRIEELGQEELASKNPYEALTSNDNEARTLGDKMNDASQKLSSTLGDVTQKVKSTFSKDTTAVDKENARQTA